MGTDLQTTVFIGDQLFTDVYGAKRTGMHNILVKPIHPKEEIQIVLKRKLEKNRPLFLQERPKKAKKQLKNRMRYYTMEYSGKRDAFPMEEFKEEYSL